MTATLVVPSPAPVERSDALKQIAVGLEDMARGIRVYAAVLDRQPAPSSKELLTIEDVAKALQCSTDHVRGRIRDGQMKAFKDGRLWRIAAEELEAYKRRRTR